jgi:DNA-binding LacI/PurR family transcriptional regulator
MKSNGSRATSFDVAALAGVSQSAVSRAFTPGSSLAEDKRLRIVEAARKLNYVPNSIASSLTTKRTNIIAVLVGDMANPFYVQVLHSFSKRLQELGRQVLTFTVDPGMDTDAIMTRVLQYQVDGVVITSAKLSTRMTSISLDRGIPVVLFNRYIPGSDACCVRCDNAAGGKLIAEAFLAAGARSFAMITGDPSATTSQDRVSGFVDHLVDHGVSRRTIEQETGFATYDGGLRAAHTLFANRGRKRLPDALFCINDIMAMGAIDLMRAELGLRIPEHLMVAGFDDIPEISRLPYRLTTVRQPIDEMIEETLALLRLDRLPGPIETGIVRALPGTLVWRDTVPRG